MLGDLCGRFQASYSIIGVCRFSREPYVSNVWAFVARLMWFYWQDGLCFRIPAVREQASAVVTHSHSLLSRGPPKAASVWELGRGPAPLKHAHTHKQPYIVSGCTVRPFYFCCVAWDFLLFTRAPFVWSRNKSTTLFAFLFGGKILKTKLHFHCFHLIILMAIVWSL